MLAHTKGLIEKTAPALWGDTGHRVTDVYDVLTTPGTNVHDVLTTDN
jgi:hypothetical protein